jgi:hypothetical protein
MMNAAQVRRHASSYGFTLALKDDGSLFAKGNAKSMTPELRGLIKAHEEGLIAEIKATAAEIPDSPPAPMDDVSKWFFAFAKSEPVGCREFRGELIDVWKEYKRLFDAAAGIASDYDAQEKWLDDARYLRQAVEYGKPVEWPQEFPPGDLFPELDKPSGGQRM